ncbi:MAG: Hsp20/alpha crystallin family protein [Marinilabiliales bacterium]
MAMLSLFNQYPALFDDVFNSDLLDWVNKKFSVTNTTILAVNIKEDKQNIEVEVAAPGFNKDEFKIELNNSILTISSDKKVENETKEGQQFTRKEYSYQSFSRSFSLPEIIDENKISAKYDNGILTITLPKKEEVVKKEVKKIEIK